MNRRVATWDGRKTLSVLIATFAISFLIPYGFIAILFTSLLLVHQLLLRLIFTGPEKRSLPFDDPRWDVIKVDNNGVDVYGFINYQDEKSDMAVFIHGWQSSSEKYTERMLLFRDRGLHTLAIDSRGHGMAPDTPEWTAGKVILDIKCILESVEVSRVNKIHFYGHSLGGFIAIGMHHSRHSGWWKENYGTLILESPMAAYSPILEQMSGRISFMLPLLKRWALKGFNKIHPEAGGLEWKDIDVPHWGLPKVPILLLQAETDNRLGRYHYDLLMSQELDITGHLIKSLPHSKNRVNDDRDKIIVEWIENRIL